jgi:hypothetical protein
MPRRARKGIVGQRDDIARQEREDEYTELRRALRTEWRNRPEDQFSDNYEPEYLADEE